MSSWPVDATSEVDWEAYRLKHASLEEQAAAAAKQEPEPTTRKRTTKTDG